MCDFIKECDTGDSACLAFTGPLYEKPDCLKEIKNQETSEADVALNALLYSGTGWYCTECKTLCDMYEQGLTCCCGAPWEGETINEKDYPTKWVKVAVEAKRI